MTDTTGWTTELRGDVPGWAHLVVLDAAGRVKADRLIPEALIDDEPALAGLVDLMVEGATA